MNLANTGLTEAMLWPFGAALRRTKSLRSIHLSGNEITPKLLKYLVKRIRSNGVYHENTIPFNEMPSNIRFREYLHGSDSESSSKEGDERKKGGNSVKRKNKQVADKKKIGLDLSKLIVQKY